MADLACPVSLYLTKSLMINTLKTASKYENTIIHVIFEVYKLGKNWETFVFAKALNL